MPGEKKNAPQSGRENRTDVERYTQGNVGALSIYRMQLLGTEGVRRYLDTGYIPEDLLD